MELEAFYAAKYTPLEVNESELARAILHAHVAHHSPPLTCFTEKEVLHALSLQTGQVLWIRRCAL